MKFFLRIMTIFFVSFPLVSCLCNPDHKSKTTQDGNEVAAKKKVHLAIWNDFIAEDLIRTFEQETGIQVELSTYPTNEELLTKIQAGGTSYDVIVPSEYMVKIMSKLDLLSELNKSQIPNIKNIEVTRLGGPEDPQNIFSLPYLWTYSLIAINASKFNEEITGWQDFLEKAQLKGRIGYTDDAREALGIALKTTGKSLNSRDPQDIALAKQFLIDLKIKQQAMVGDDFSLIQRGDIFAGQFYSSDALLAAQNQPHQMQFVVPKEGGSISTEQLVILKDSSHKEEAHALINFLLKPESSAQIVAKVFAGPVVKGTRDLLPEHLRDHPIIFPAPEKIQSYETIRDVGDATALYEKAWVEFKSI